MSCWVVPSELTREGTFRGATAVLDSFDDLVSRLVTPSA
jgi:hypothetical protein